MQIATFSYEYGRSHSIAVPNTNNYGRERRGSIWTYDMEVGRDHVYYILWKNSVKVLNSSFGESSSFYYISDSFHDKVTT